METVVAANVVRPSTLEVSFAEGFRRGVDIEQFLWGTVIQPLRDPAYVALVRVDKALGTIVSANGSDLAPEVISHGEDTPDSHVNVARHEPTAAAARETV
jgi:hypothetical protein